MLQQRHLHLLVEKRHLRVYQLVCETDRFQVQGIDSDIRVSLINHCAVNSCNPLHSQGSVYEGRDWDAVPTENVRWYDLPKPLEVTAPSMAFSLVSTWNCESDSGVLVFTLD